MAILGTGSPGIGGFGILVVIFDSEIVWDNLVSKWVIRVRALGLS
jgi:hypothetical protein